MAKPLTEDQIEILEAFRAFYYSGKIPHLAVVQQYPGRKDEMIGFENLLEDFKHDYMINQAGKKDS